jgi:glycosyltransferase involved in cell wall biosynthesis
VDLDRFQPSPPHKDAAVKLILFAGRLDPVKRPLMLVRIAIEVAALRKARDFRFVVVGDGSEMGLLRESVRREGTETLFEFRGYVEDMAPLFAASDVVVLTSKSEGIPLVILEAFASSRPVVASNVGAVAELLDANCGVLIEVTSHDSSDFAVAIDNLLNRPELRERMGAMGRKKVEEHFNRRQCLEAYARLFE